MIECRKCHVFKAESEYYFNKSKGKVERECKACARARILAWQKDNPERYAQNLRRTNLKKKYGLTPETWDELLEQQGNRCAICGEAKPRGGWHTDHCHETGIVRGILCSPCNRGIGYLKDSASVLRNAIDYLEGVKV